MKFKVGDRVAVYGVWVFAKWYERLTTKIDEIYPSGNLRVMLNNKMEIVHPKQCRRLKPKKRQVIWAKREDLYNMGKNSSDDLIVCRFSDPDNKLYWIKFTEVKDG